VTEAAALSWSRMSPSAIVAMDADGRVTDMNAAAEALLGVALEQARARPYTEVFGPSLADRLVPLAMRAAKRGREPQTVEATLPGGRRATLRANAGPLLDQSGALVGMVFAAEDKSALRRYVGADLAAAVDARPSLLDLGGRRQVVSVLHADVRGYSTLAERMEPEEVMRLLLSYHGAATAALRSSGGTVDRFIGDAVLALWNAPAAQEEHALMAVRGGLAMLAAAERTGATLRYGVGVHTGTAVVGNLGSESLATYTAIGDTVNVAARLQGGAAAGELVCSAATAEAIGPRLRATSLGAILVKGRSAQVEAYRVEGLSA
jgi:PAS domain S-box-containing protein